MLKKLLVTLVAAAFAAGAYAQAPKSDAAKPATPSVQAQKADSKAGTKTAKKGKAKAKSAKGKAKAKADEKKDSGKTSK
jgi:hypothetical protein